MAKKEEEEDDEKYIQRMCTGNFISCFFKCLNEMETKLSELRPAEFCMS